MSILPPERLVDSSLCPICGTRLPWAGMGYAPHPSERCARRQSQARAELLGLLLRRQHDPALWGPSFQATVRADLYPCGCTTSGAAAGTYARAEEDAAQRAVRELVGRWQTQGAS